MQLLFSNHYFTFLRFTENSWREIHSRKFHSAKIIAGKRVARKTHTCREKEKVNFIVKFKFSFQIETSEN